MSKPRTDDLVSPFEPRSAGWVAVVAWAAIVALCITHGWIVWVAMGGWETITNPWPPAVHDHPTYFHSALVTRQFLRQTWTTAGYDPAFMAGYPKSIVFPASSTLWEVLFLLAGEVRPELTYKLGMFAFVTILPGIVALSGALLRLRPGATAAAVGWYLVYIWNDFPINYAFFGMVPYLLSIPVALLTTAILFRYLEHGNFRWGLAATAASALMLLIHFTSLMIVGPAVLAAWLGAWSRARSREEPRPRGRGLGLVLIGLVAVALNVFWWWPGLFLASTKGASDFVFTEKGASLLDRLGRIVGREPRIQLTLWILGPPGLIVLARRDRLAAITLTGFAGAGFAWGYLAGIFRFLDFLQAGRHTYAFYSALAIGAGVGLAELVARAARIRRILGPILTLGLIGCVVLEFWDPAGRVLKPIFTARLPFLSSKPTPRLLWIVNRIRAHVRPGERLLYEEGGFDIQGLADPYGGGRYSGLLPHLTGVEVLGGPYLHAALQENFTQFGEGKLFGKVPWTEADFRRYARLYRPSAIVCWAPWSRQFCYDHPELIDVKEDDGLITIGRVKGFEGATIRGKAEVAAGPGRLRVRALSGELDGLVVLRYHFVPCLRSRPAVPLVPVSLEDDPVPFLGLRPGPGEVTIEMGFPP